MDFSQKRSILCLLMLWYVGGNGSSIPYLAMGLKIPSKVLFFIFFGQCIMDYSLP